MLKRTGSDSQRSRPSVQRTSSDSKSLRPSLDRTGSVCNQNSRPSLQSATSGNQPSRPSLNRSGSSNQPPRPLLKGNGSGDQPSRPSLQRNGSGGQCGRLYLEKEMEESVLNEGGGRASFERGGPPTASTPRGRRVGLGRAASCRNMGQQPERPGKVFGQEDLRMTGLKRREHLGHRRRNSIGTTAPIQAENQPWEKARDNKLDRIAARRQGNRRFGRRGSTGGAVQQNSFEIESEENDNERAASNADTPSADQLGYAIDNTEDDDDEDDEEESHEKEKSNHGRRNSSRTARRLL